MPCLEIVPVQYRAGATRAAEALKGMENILLAAHVNLDGDALGSLCSCGYILRDLGKRFAIYSSSGVPEYLRFIDMPGKVYVDLAAIPFELESAVYLDCGECSRLGSQLSDACRDLPSVNIDHHISDGSLGTLAAFASPSAAATTQLVAYVAMNLGVPLAGSLGEAIALGLITDTGGFCHGNTNGDVFALCAVLADNGCSFSRLRERLQNNWTFKRLRLWGDLFSRTRLFDSGKIALCKVSLEELRERDCAPEDIEGVVEWLRKIRSVKVAAVIREEKDGICKFSLRSYGDVDARSMAASLGGGGHFNAAGGLVDAPLDEAANTLIGVIERGLEQKNEGFRDDAALA